jgi:hypothetical protein
MRCKKQGGSQIDCQNCSSSSKELAQFTRQFAAP